MSEKSQESPPPVKPGRKVGFQRPTLVIPPPDQNVFYPSTHPKSATLSGQKSATISGPASALPYNNYFYMRRQSNFYFNNIKDLTKSGLNVGEKSAFWMYNKLKAWSRKWFTHFFLTIVISLYTIGGAIMFSTIEGQNEEKIVEGDIRRDRYELIRDLRNLSIVFPNEYSIGEWEGEAERRMKIFETKLLETYQKHALIVANRGDKIWTFWNSLVYCSTIFTTIGYGHIYPTTTTGRVLTIVYSIFGIPLFLIALTDFGKLFTRCIKFLWSFVRRLYYTGSCKRYRKQAHMEDIFKGAQMMYDIATFRRPSFTVDPEALQKGDIPQNLNIPTPLTGENADTPTTPALSNFEIDDEFNLPISVAITILLAYIFMGALIYCMWEDWNFFASFYFVFISMSTIGFGDYVPHHPICMIVSIVYLVFGLALMSMCINVVQEKLSDTFKHASAKIGATMGLRVDEDGSITTVPPDAIEMPPIHGAIDVNIDKNLEDEKNLNLEKNKTDDKSNFLQVNTEVNNVKDKLS